MDNSYSVDVFQCEEAGVFVGTSEDIPGLSLEADTLGGLLEAVLEMVPQLIEQNLGLPQDADIQVMVRVRKPLRAKARERLGDSQSSSLPKPRYVVEEDLRPLYA